MPSKALVLDANILIRAVPGRRVRRILEVHASAPGIKVAEARKRLDRPRPERLAGFGGCLGALMRNLDGRHGFLRLRRRNVDIGDHREFPGAMTLRPFLSSPRRPR